MAEEFSYDPASETYTARWEDCTFLVTNVCQDAKHGLTADVKAVLAEDGAFLAFQTVHLTRPWSVEPFAQVCDARPEAQQQVKRYLGLIADWITERHIETARETTNGAHAIDAARFPFVDTTAKAPELPQRAACAPPGLHTWLSEYVAHSAYWAPRAAPSFHTAVGLWVLSTVAARRIAVHLGSTDLYPTLFLAMTSDSTLWTKTTAASIGMKVIRRSGCGCFLGPDRTTPQFLLKIMAGVVPPAYGQADPQTQQMMREIYGFAAQRGWFYEEWGGMLHQMRRTDSPQAELNKLLIVLEGGAPSFETGTIARGLERIESPYLALLGNATLRDLRPFMAEGDAWWHDGFWPRFIFATPPPDTKPGKTPRPREAYTIPANLIIGLSDWHHRLGFPQVTIEEIVEESGKRTGEWRGTTHHFPEQELTLDDAVYDAYECYNDALLDLLQNGEVHSDLSAWYGRAHEKALRIAMLLASVQGDTTITLPYWQEAQCLVEGWRMDLHTLTGVVGEEGPQTRQGQRQIRLEHRIEHLLAMSGGMTARELQQNMKGVTSEELRGALKSMIEIEALSTVKVGKKILYLIFQEEEEDETDPSVDL